MIGLTLITIGYAIPRNYKFDPHKPARVMEAIENEYARKRFALNVCIMVGTGFVTFSGLIISFIVTWELCSSENADNDPEDPERPCKPPSYGSVVAESEAMDSGAAAAATAAATAASFSQGARNSCTGSWSYQLKLETRPLYTSSSNFLWLRKSFTYILVEWTIF